jgi:hypothetical protein
MTASDDGKVVALRPVPTPTTVSGEYADDDLEAEIEDTMGLLHDLLTERYARMSSGEYAGIRVVLRHPNRRTPT